MNRITSVRRDRKNYVIVTAAYNEERFIERVITSVTTQTIAPLRWIIVSDASTDATDDIVRKYAKQYGYIELLRITEDHARNFAAQVNAINLGFARSKGLNYDLIGNLDSDVSFEATYFENLLQKFDSDPQLGLAGGEVYEERNGEFRPRDANNPLSVAHAVQMFRRECFEPLGGYVPLPFGGPDWHAVVRCRMNGWGIQSFSDLPVFHHRPTGSVGGWVRSAYRQGMMDFSMGSHPLFEIARIARRIPCRPYILYASVRLYGFISSFLRRQEVVVSDDFVKFLRAEEMDRLRRALRI